MNHDKTKVMTNSTNTTNKLILCGKSLDYVNSLYILSKQYHLKTIARRRKSNAGAPGERAHDARRPPGGSLKSHPVVGVALTPRYSPRPRLDNVRPAAAPPEEPAEPDPVTGTPPTGPDEPDEPAALRLDQPVSTTPPGPT
ncbi:unnamed protein product [Arctia plantaginis]|uniref:Uncharacterized protein n=1 Tax=Arctia plantaginis TaxID=874455 RepID=A0A8S0ZYI5_ARCPL|nr:unnamed protein product [Arctia plantaginis]